MANLNEINSDGSLINEGLDFVANVAPTQGQGINPATQASYIAGNTAFVTGDEITSALITGTGFTYDSNGFLRGGVITAIEAGYDIYGGAFGSDTYTNISLPVSYALSLDSTPGGAEPTVLAGNNTINVMAPTATGYGGNDTFDIMSGGLAAVPQNTTTTNVNGGGGVNTADFAALRSIVTVSGGGGNETVSQPVGVTANLVSIDKIQFIDGSIYEDNATPGARAALAFEGILGRLPDAINAGGYGQIAEQSDAQTAARALLATPEGQADTANLSTSDFVTRLYENMLHRAPDAAGAAGWQADLDTGQLDRGTVVASFAGSSEAQQVNSAAFASGGVFAADPGSVEALRAYEVLLNRLPEASSLGNVTATLDNGLITLQQLYSAIQGSAEFKADASTGQGNPYGITSTTSYASVRAIALSDPVTSLIMPLVTSNGVAVHS